MRRALDRFHPRHRNPNRGKTCTNRTRKDINSIRIRIAIPSERMPATGFDRSIPARAAGEAPDLRFARTHPTLLTTLYPGCSGFLALDPKNY